MYSVELDGCGGSVKRIELNAHMGSPVTGATNE